MKTTEYKFLWQILRTEELVTHHQIFCVLKEKFNKFVVAIVMI